MGKCLGCDESSEYLYEGYCESCIHEGDKWGFCENCLTPLDDSSIEVFCLECWRKSESDISDADILSSFYP